MIITTMERVTLEKQLQCVNGRPVACERYGKQCPDFKADSKRPCRVLPDVVESVGINRSIGLKYNAHIGHKGASRVVSEYDWSVNLSFVPDIVPRGHIDTMDVEGVDNDVIFYQHLKNKAPRVSYSPDWASFTAKKQENRVLYLRNNLGESGVGEVLEFGHRRASDAVDYLGKDGKEWGTYWFIRFRVWADAPKCSLCHNEGCGRLRESINGVEHSVCPAGARGRRTVGVCEQRFTEKQLPAFRHLKNRYQLEAGGRVLRIRFNKFRGTWRINK